MLLRAISCLSAAVAVTACGGGSNLPTDPSAAYTGTWVSSCYAEGDSVYRYLDAVSLRPIGETTMQYAGSLSSFVTSDCSGASEDVADYSGALKWSGDKSTGSSIVDKVLVTPDEQEATKTVFVVRDGELVVGKKSATVDADGYPTAADAAYRLIRQH